MAKFTDEQIKRAVRIVVTMHAPFPGDFDVESVSEDLNLRNAPMLHDNSTLGQAYVRLEEVFDIGLEDRFQTLAQIQGYMVARREDIRQIELDKIEKIWGGIWKEK